MTGTKDIECMREPPFGYSCSIYQRSKPVQQTEANEVRKRLPAILLIPTIDQYTVARRGKSSQTEESVS